jgi:hypothetical protein
MSLTSQTNNGFVTSIQTPTDTVPNAIGLSDVESIRANLTNVQKMVNFDAKAIYTNIIGKYDRIPIQVIDPINISNTFFVGGTDYTGSGSGGTGSGTSITNGTSRIDVYSNLSTALNGVVQITANSTLAASFDSNGNFLYQTRGYPGVSTGTFTVNGNFVTTRFRLPSSINVSSMYLQADASGNGFWHTLDTLENSNVRFQAVSNGSSGWQQGFNFTSLSSTRGNISSLGFIDANGIWNIGQSNYVLNADLKSSNNVLVASNIRFKEATGQVGHFIRAANIYGDLEYVAAGTIDTYLTDQITSCNSATTVLAQNNSISFGIGGGEVVRINSNGFLGLGNPLPLATLDNSNATILRSTLQLPNLHPGYTARKGYLLTAIDNSGTATWQNISSIADGNGNSITIGAVGAAIALAVNGQNVLYATTTSNLIASGGASPVTMDISGIILAQQYRGYSDTINFTKADGSVQAVITAAGNVGIGTQTPGYMLTVAGSGYIGGNLTVNTSLRGNQQITAGVGFVGDGSQITNINPLNVGTSSNNLSFFYTDTRANLSNQSTQTSQNLSTMFGTVSTASFELFSTLSTQTYSVWNSLSTTTGGVLSTLYGVSNVLSTVQDASFSTLSSGTVGVYIVLSTAVATAASTTAGNLSTTSNYFSSFISSIAAAGLANTSTSISGLSTLIGPGYYATSTATYAYINQQFSTASSRLGLADEIIEILNDGASFQQIHIGSVLPTPRISSSVYTADISGSVLFRNGPVYLSTIVGVQYPLGSSLDGALDVNGLVYSKGIATKFGDGPTFYRQGSTLGGWGADNRFIIGKSSLSYFGTGIDISGNINLTGNLYVNDNEIELSPTWNKVGSNATYTTGFVGIGTTAPQNSLDVAGTIRCQGLQIVSFVDPGTGGGNTGDVALVNIRTSTLAVSTINSFPAFPTRSGWSDLLLQSSLTTVAKVVCSTSVTLNASSFLMASANHNMVNTTGSLRTGYTYLTVNGYQSLSTMISVPANSGAAVSLAHRIYEGPGTYTVAAWSYADSGTGSLVGIRADVSAIGNMF